MKTVDVYAKTKEKYTRSLGDRLWKEFGDVIEEVNYYGREIFLPINDNKGIIWQFQNIDAGLAKKLMAAFNKSDGLYAKVREAR